MSLISANDSAALVFALNQNTASQAFAITATSPRVLLVDDEPMLLNSLCELLKGRACREFVDNQERFGMTPDAIPRFDDLNEVLARTTGWQLVARGLTTLDEVDRVAGGG